MTIDFKSFNEAYKKFCAEHPKVAAGIVVVESAFVGAVVDVFTNGVDFTKNGLKHAAVIIGTAVGMAVRNYLKSNAADLKLKLQQTQQ